jgi:predicted DNA-binding transcriptional regulator AlpA
MLPTFIRFNDLKARGIAKSWAQLGHLQKHHGFPAGRLLSPQIRAWTEEEVADWLATRPTDKAPLRGAARVVTEIAAQEVA